MSVRQLKNGRWIADVVVGRKLDGTPDRRTETCGTKAAAKKAERRLLVLKEKSRGRVTDSMTLSEFIESVYWPQKPNMRHNTRRGYERDIRLRLLPAFGDVPVGEIGRLGIQRMISSCPTRKVATNARETLSSILGVAVEMGMMDVNPAGFRYQYPPPGGHAPDHYGEWLTTFAEHKAVLDRVAELHPGDVEERILVLGLCLGLRKGEVFGMDWGDVDLDGRTASVRRSYTLGEGGPRLTEPKTPRATRTLPLTEYALSRMRAWGPSDGPVLTNAEGGRLSPSTGAHRFRRMVERETFADGSPLPGLSVYSLRHSFATACINAGMEIAKVSAMLGHCDVSTTYNIYVKPKVADLRVSVGMIDDAYGGRMGD